MRTLVLLVVLMGCSQSQQCLEAERIYDELPTPNALNAALVFTVCME